MKVKVSFQLGATNYEFDIEEGKEEDVLHKAIILGNPPRYCNVCGNTRFFKLDSNRATSKKDGRTFIYINVVCLAKGCYAKAKLSQYTAGGYYWNKFEKYQPDTPEQQPNQDYNQAMGLEEPPIDSYQ